jgi:hypothetical protein
VFGFIIAALLAEVALYLTHYLFLWLLPPCFYLLERSVKSGSGSERVGGWGGVGYLNDLNAST